MKVIVAIQNYKTFMLRIKFNIANQTIDKSVIVTYKILYAILVLSFLWLNSLYYLYNLVYECNLDYTELEDIYVVD